jgi:hypothetical protein
VGRRVWRLFEDLAVALATSLGLSSFDEGRVRGLVHHVAAGARDLLAMRPFVPMGLLALVVTFETDLVSFGDRCLAMLCEDDVADLHGEFHVDLARAVAALALLA